MKESKADRFRRVADARVNKIIKMIRLLGNCSGTGVYEYRNVILENNMTLSYAIGTLKSCFAELYSAESFAVKVSVSSAAPKTETI